MAPLLGDASHLGRGELGIPDGGDGQGDEAPRLGAAPAVDVPVVVGPHHGQCLVLVLPAGEQLTAELGEGGEAHGTEHAVDGHVPHPLVDVVAADAHVVERGRLESVLLGRASDDGVEPDVGDLVAVVLPVVGAVGAPYQLRCLVLVLRRQPAVEHAPGLNHVVVHTDQNQIFGAHATTSPGVKTFLTLVSSTLCAVTTSSSDAQPRDPVQGRSRSPGVRRPRPPAWAQPPPGGAE